LISSDLLSSMCVPIMCVNLLKHTVNPGALARVP
jgi:hypothetical protein